MKWQIVNKPMTHMVVPCFHSESKSTLMKYTSCRQSRSLASRFRPQVLKDLPLSQNPVQRMKKFHWESSVWTWCSECVTTNTRQKLQVVTQGKNTRCWYAVAVAWKVGTCFDFHLCVCVCVLVFVEYSETKLQHLLLSKLNRWWLHSQWFPSQLWVTVNSNLRY